MRDFISIGGEVSRALGIHPEENGEEQEQFWYEKLGKNFYEFVHHTNAHQLVKQIRFDLFGLELLSYGVEHISDVSECVYTVITRNGARCKFALYNKFDAKKEAFMIADLAGFTDQFVIISGIESMEAGAGKQLLAEVIQCIGDKLPILVDVCSIYAGDYYTDNDNTVDKNVKIFTDAGFRNVNDVIGGYEFSIAMLRCSDELYEKIMNPHE